MGKKEGIGDQMAPDGCETSDFQNQEKQGIGERAYFSEKKIKDGRLVFFSGSTFSHSCVYSAKKSASRCFK